MRAEVISRLMDKSAYTVMDDDVEQIIRERLMDDGFAGEELEFAFKLAASMADILDGFSTEVDDEETDEQ